MSRLWLQCSSSSFDAVCFVLLTRLASHSAPRHQTAYVMHVTEAGGAGAERGQRSAEKTAVQRGERERKRRLEEAASDEVVEDVGSAARDKEYPLGRGPRGGLEGVRQGIFDVGMQQSNGRHGRASTIASVGKKGKRKLGAKTGDGAPAEEERGTQSGSDHEPAEEDEASSSATHVGAVLISSAKRQRMRQCKGKLTEACVVLVHDKPPGTCTSVVLAKFGSSVQRREAAEEDCEEEDSSSKHFVPGLEFEKETGKLMDMIPLFGSDRAAVKGKNFLRDDRSIDLFGILKYGTEQEQQVFWEALRVEKACKAKERARHAKVDLSDPTSVAQHLAFMVSQGKTPKKGAALALSKHLLRAHLDGAAGPASAIADGESSRYVRAREDAAQELPNAGVENAESGNAKATLIRDYAKLIYGKDGVKQAISSLSPPAAPSVARSNAEAAATAPAPSRFALGPGPVNLSSRNITGYRHNMLHAWQPQPVSAPEAPMAASGGGAPMSSYQSQLLGMYHQQISMAQQQQACGSPGAVPVPRLAPMLALSAQIFDRALPGLQRPSDGRYHRAGINEATARSANKVSLDVQIQGFVHKVKIRFALEAEVFPKFNLLLKSFANQMGATQSDQERDTVLRELREHVSSLFQCHEDLVAELLNIVEPLRNGAPHRNYASAPRDMATEVASEHRRTESATFTCAQPEAGVSLSHRTESQTFAGAGAACRGQADLGHAAAGCAIQEDLGALAAHSGQAEMIMALEGPILNAASPCHRPPQAGHHDDQCVGTSDDASGMASLQEAGVHDDPKAWLKEVDASLCEAGDATARAPTPVLEVDAPLCEAGDATARAPTPILEIDVPLREAEDGTARAPTPILEVDAPLCEAGDATARAPTPILHPGACADGEPEGVEQAPADGASIADVGQETVDDHLKETCVDPLSVSGRDQVAVEPVLHAEREERSSAQETQEAQEAQEAQSQQMQAPSSETDTAVAADPCKGLPDPCAGQTKSPREKGDEKEASAACASCDEHAGRSDGASPVAPAADFQEDIAGKTTLTAGMACTEDVRVPADAHIEEGEPQQVGGGDSGAGTSSEDQGVLNRVVAPCTPNSPQGPLQSGFSASLSPLLLPAASDNVPPDLADTFAGIDESVAEAHVKHYAVALPTAPKSSGPHLQSRKSFSDGGPAGSGGMHDAGMLGAEAARFEGRKGVDEDAENSQPATHCFESTAQLDRRSGMESERPAGNASSLRVSRNVLDPQQGVVRPGAPGPSSMLARRAAAGPAGGLMASSNQGVDEQRGCTVQTPLVRVPKVSPGNACSGFSLPHPHRKHVVSFEAAFGLL